MQNGRMKSSKAQNLLKLLTRCENIRQQGRDKDTRNNTVKKIGREKNRPRKIDRGTLKITAMLEFLMLAKSLVHPS